MLFVWVSTCLPFLKLYTNQCNDYAPKFLLFNQTGPVKFTSHPFDFDSEFNATPVKMSPKKNGQIL